MICSKQSHGRVNAVQNCTFKLHHARQRILLFTSNRGMTLNMDISFIGSLIARRQVKKINHTSQFLFWLCSEMCKSCKEENKEMSSSLTYSCKALQGYEQLWASLCLSYKKQFSTITKIGYYQC